MLILSAMASKIKTLVSKKKKRYQEGGFDLDLTCKCNIDDNVIAMGFPAEKLEGVYRNHIDDVVKFFDSKHKDHFMIYNLCAERDYDHARFHERVRRFPFDDHNPPRLTEIKAFCEDVTQWLSKNNENVAAIHCKAGKGRTGVMITAYLLHSRRCPSAKDALEFYGKKRTYDEKGVTIPSQRRYVEYYGQLVNSGFKYQSTTLLLKSICFHPMPINTAATSPRIVIYQYNEDKVLHEVFTSELIELKKGVKCMYYKLTRPVSVTGDIKVEFSNPKMMKKDRIFTFWFNTFFVQKTSELDCETASLIPSVHSASSSELSVNDSANVINASEDSSEDYTLVLRKEELDKANKDKAHKIFPSDFKVIVNFKKLSQHSSNSVSPRPHSMSCHNAGIRLMGDIYRTNREHGYRTNQETGVANSDNEYPESETETEETDEEWEGCQTEI
ncbi:phosphatidylinositol 3:4:5-trisphosphate 3-phosphatase and dual-specificity protein phosphatase PTEN-like isoform X2 [Leptotrombidium deliense]|uniref:Phosphatidylinositol 3,4,5-trisphosphate 3-phosphatase and dual-specificity protein phosphatase PTEN n=1 Tax=Leptotrombidium deliense TaxID=299467 RepID=A0A443SMT6_9ACAR|nr:phosphatidylinositol 3:4:5-trisphosphate 3-phosphatase and dual-specificity protein phosphatase PTEN-like isoform X2 [Leptotrombidium deliense]